MSAWSRPAFKIVTSVQLNFCKLGKPSGVNLPHKRQCICGPKYLFCIILNRLTVLLATKINILLTDSQITSMFLGVSLPATIIC